MNRKNYRAMFRFKDITHRTHIEFLYHPAAKEYAVAIDGQIVFETKEKIAAWNFFSQKTDMVGRKRIQTAAGKDD